MRLCDKEHHRSLAVDAVHDARFFNFPSPGEHNRLPYLIKSNLRIVRMHPVYERFFFIATIRMHHKAHRFVNGNHLIILVKYWDIHNKLLISPDGALVHETHRESPQTLLARNQATMSTQKRVRYTPTARLKTPRGAYLHRCG